MSAALEFSPLLSLTAIAVLAALTLSAAALALWRGSPGWALRGLAALAVLAALSGPSLKRELRDPLPDIAFLVVDESASNRIDGRDLQARAAAGELGEALTALGADPAAPLEWRLVTVRDAEGPRRAEKGTRLLAALEAAAEDEAAAEEAAAEEAASE